MSVAAMASGVLCSCAHLPAAEASGRALLQGTSINKFGLGRISRLGSVKKGRRLRVQAAVEIDGKPVSNGPLRGSKAPPKQVLMVDPLEAKRLAAVEWKLLQERLALQKQQRIEAINGGWAVLGLTIGIVIEGYTGKGILAQIAGYLDSLAEFLASITPGTPVP